MATFPVKPEALLTRKALAEALTELGYRISPATLASKATRGGGPPFRRFNSRALYKWQEAFDWAQSKTTAPRRNTAEADLPKTGKQAP